MSAVMCQLAAGLAAAVVAGTGCSRPGLTGGDYGPVTAAQLQGVHDCVATGRSGATFVWEFVGGRFHAAGDGGALPDDATAALLGGPQAANVIEGRWTLANRTLTLTDVTADGAGGFANVQLKPFRTPVVRVELNGTQYVLRPRRH